MRRVATSGIVALALVACGGTREAEVPEDYARIISVEEGCDDLQVIHDDAATKRAEARNSGDLEAARSFDAAMQAASDRVRAVGCS